ncbi:MAG: translation initiation factor IF-2 [Clostridia bacterium]|nr:translation initiation factor IF-2 [Clostridia bacterium]
MADMVKVKDFAKNFGLDIKDATKIIEDSGLLGSAQVGETVEMAVINTIVNKITLDNQSKISDYLAGGTKKAEKPAEKKEKIQPKAEKPVQKTEKPQPKAEKPAEAKKPEVKPEIKAEAKKPEIKPEAKVEAKPEIKAEPKVEKAPEFKKQEQRPEARQDNRQDNRQDRPQQDRNQRNDRFDRNNQQGGQRPQFDKNEKKPFNKDFNRDGGNQFKNDGAKKIFNKDFNRDNQRPQQNNFFKDSEREDNRPKFTPKPKPQTQPKPENTVVEIKKKTGATRVVDTRVSSVDLSKYDEKLDSFGSYDHYGSSKQKLKKQNNKDSYGSKKEKERSAMEKMKRAAFEKAKNTQLSITVPDEITVGELATRLKVSSSELIKKLMMMGVMATVNQLIDYDTAYLMADEMGAKVTKEVVVTIEEKLFDESEDTEDSLKERAPVVCVMGHVDHGKTSLLDAIRHTHVTTGEAGGITQHIGAYSVNIDGKDITFLDTPGHEAFTAMRLRGAMATDIAIIVVAADDGIMPQTVEAINHAKAAGVDIIVAINKMDKPTANPDQIMQELTKYDLVPEQWGGDVICVPVSAHTRMGLDDLLETILLVAEVKELKANPDRRAKGIVIEAKLDKGKGPVATILVQNGTLRSGDVVIAGTAVGHVRAMTDHKGKVLKLAGPSVPVEITGLDEVPLAGDEFNAVEDEKMARTLAEQRKQKAKEEIFKANAKLNLDDLFSQISEGVKEINIIVKADVGGSAEAVKSSLVKLSNAEVKVNVIHMGVGGITESDVMLAGASNAIIVGFNVRPDKSALDSAARQNIDIRTHRIIYEIIEEIEAAMKGMLAPTFKEVINGHAEVRQTIRVPNVGTIAGSYIQDGKVTRSSQIRVLRDSIVIFEDKISSLRRFKDDVKEVAAGYECGIGLDKFDDIKEGDILEAFEMQEVSR